MCLLAGLVASAPARAEVAFTPQDLSAFTDSSVEALIMTVGLGANHRDLRGATPLGMTVGLDVGVEAIVLYFPKEFIDAMSLATSGGEVPQQTVLPRLNVHKGLPLGIDLGFSWVGYKTNGRDNSILGASVAWTFLKGGLVKPSLAARVSFARAVAPAFFLNASTWKFDAVVSKSFGPFFEPHLIVGLETTAGSLEVPTNLPAGLPASVGGSSSKTMAHVAGGFTLKMLVLRLTGEYDHSFSGVRSLAAKASIAF